MSTKTALWLTWALFAGLLGGTAWAQFWSPDSLPGCRVVSAAPTYAIGQLVSNTCTTDGRLRTQQSP